MDLRRATTVALVAVLAVSCTPGGSPDPASTDAATASPDVAVDATEDAPAEQPGGCGDPDRPCDPAEVDPAVAARVDELYDELGVLLGEGADTGELLELLRAQPDVLAAGAGPDAVRFHVAGAVPSWLFVRTGLTTVGAPPASGDATLALSPPAPLPSITIDRDSEEKSALLLSPYDWQWSYYGLDGGSRSHARTLDDVRDYEDRVTTLVDRLVGSTIERQVPLEAWESFDDHDYVHVFTHGSYWCGDGGPGAGECDDRRVGLATLSTPEELSAAFGQPGDGEQDSVADAVLRSGGFETGRVGIAPRRGETTGDELPNTATDPFPYGLVTDEPPLYGAGPFVVLTADYFRAAYPGGLRDTVVLLTSCSAGGDSDVQRALAGPGSAVFGWSRTVTAQVGIDVAQRVVELLVERDETGGEDVGGFRAATVLDRLVEEATAGGPGAIVDTEVSGGSLVDVDTGAALGVVGDRDARARELPFLLDEDGEELEARGVLEVVGQPGDGRPDRLELVIEVDGISDELDAATIDLSVGVNEATTYDVQQRLDQPVGRSLWRTTFGIDLDRDLEPGERVDLRVEAQLPDGFTAWTYEELRPCGLTPDGNRIPFALPDGAEYLGPTEFPDAHRYRVPGYDAALSHLRAAIAADPDHAQIDDPGLSRIGDLRDDGFTLLGTCYPRGGFLSLQEQEDGSVTLDVYENG